MSSLDAHKIRSREEFEGLQGVTVGGIVNVDTPTARNVIHRPWCDHLSAQHYQTKAIDNSGRTGGYYYFLRLDDAQVALAAEPCAHCFSS